MTDRLYTQADLDAAVLAERERLEKPLADLEAHIHHVYPNELARRISGLCQLFERLAAAIRERTKP